MAYIPLTTTEMLSLYIHSIQILPLYPHMQQGQQLLFLFLIILCFHCKASYGLHLVTGIFPLISPNTWVLLNTKYDLSRASYHHDDYQHLKFIQQYPADPNHEPHETVLFLLSQSNNAIEPLSISLHNLSTLMVDITLVTMVLILPAYFVWRELLPKPSIALLSLFACLHLIVSSLWHI